MYSGSQLRESEAADINPHLLVAKLHEPQAIAVERDLQKQFRRASIFVIPQTQYTDSKMSGIKPCLRVVDAKKPKAEFGGRGMNAVKALYSQFYGDQSVYVSVDDLTIMPKGDALKWVVDHMLKLRYGHDCYEVEYYRSKLFPWKSSILIEAVAFNRHPTETGIESFLRVAEVFKNGGDIEEVPEVKVPREVADYVLDISRRFRPDITFGISIETKLWNARPVYAPGFVPDVVPR